jgi:spore maturation protein CgeB
VRLAYVSALYPAYAGTFAARETPAGHAFAGWRDALEQDAFGWAGAWGPALAPLGWTVLEVWTNLEPMQRAWAREQGGFAADAPLADIALAQVERFQPDVLWYDHHDEKLYARLVDRCPSLRATVGWTGSVLADSPLWRAYDLVLSCAPETVAALARGGVRAALLTHAFNERVLERLAPRHPALDVSFVGQIAPDHPLHAHRERLLDELLAEVDVQVYSPAAGTRAPSRSKVIPRRVLYAGVEALRRSGLSEATLRRLPLIGRAAGWPSAPRGAVPERLRRALRPGRFGLEMYRTLRDSKITLNVHAGEVTRATSNMRLFEATGVGACLLTDRADNLGELFDPEREVATFHDAASCRARIRTLLEHDAEREAIASAGQVRCLAGHTFRHRGPRLVELLRGVVR